MLVSAKADLTAKKWIHKKCLIGATSTGNCEMILVLLAKVITLYMGFAIIKI